MAALTKGRNTPRAQGDIWQYDVAAAANCHAGGIAVLSATGYLQPGSVATTLTAVGRFEESVDNSSGAAGDLIAKIQSGIFRFGNSAGADEVLRANIGDDCYIVDDQTVALTHGTNTRSRAGKVMDVDAQGVWVAIGLLY